MESLFASTAPKPLPERLRPTRLDEVVGQDHLLAPDAPIGRMVATKRLSSLILWGPPGVGKTTIARLLAQHTGHVFEQLSAVMSGVADLRKVMEAARQRRLVGEGSVLFLDEIHRWTKSQQDGLLPFVEDGTIILIGATTENPSFELNGALLSRCPVFVLKRFDHAALDQLIKRAETVLGRSLPVTPDARDALIDFADGDGRYLLNLCEQVFESRAEKPLRPEDLGRVIQRRAALYDKSSDGHYSLLSALQKSIRGSDVQAGLYYLARMLQAGEDPRAILRRLVVMATEEIGLADPNALQQSIAASEAYERLGTPEGLPAIGSLVAYLATAPKSNAAYRAFYAAMDLAERTGSLAPPAHIINAPTKLMQQMGLKAGYAYDHDHPDAFSGQEFFPDGLDGSRRPELYKPNERGFEREVVKRLRYWDDLRTKRRENQG